MLLGLACLAGAPAYASSEDAAFFESKVRPLLIERCYECHSQEKKIKGGLALDTRKGWENGGESGAAVVPGDPDKSLLIRAVRYADSTLEMPPKGKLTAEEIEIFEQWVKRGAPDPRVNEAASSPSKGGIDWEQARKHWAFQAPERGPLPEVQNKAWPKNAVDRYILSAMELRGIQPVGQAQKRDLIRRATFDLTGLPPTPQEIEAFLADSSPDAFARVVDRLLASPHYGERWGRHWLDVARYAEDQAHTFGVRPNTSGYRYRDWVIAALNADMPYDEFVKRQIAGDQLGDSPEQVRQHAAALGFFGLGAVYYKNSDKAKAEADELDDRVDTLSRGFLGLTVSCARCHDHKFDPIPTQDYYSLAGVFRSSKLSDTPLTSAEEVSAYQQAQGRIKELEAGIKQFTNQRKERLAYAEVALVPRYVGAVWKMRRQAGLPKPRPLNEVAKQENLRPSALKKWSDLLHPDNLSKFSALDPWFALSASAAGGLREEGELPTEVVSAGLAIQKNLELALEEQRAKAAAGGKAPTPPLKPQTRDLINAMFGEKGVMGIGDDELLGLLEPKDKVELGEMQSVCEAAKKAAPPMYPIAHAIAEAAPVDMKVFLRGDPKREGDVAPRRFLRVLSGDEPAPFRSGSGRRELAESIASRNNPLTARVIVNRLWHHHFGRGLVGTPSNFGALGEKPTHPELLDYLAVRLMEGGWRLKAIHREMMLSATYQLASEGHVRNEEVDADNRWRWRMNRVRLDVESWRDALLSVSGRLVPELGGPSLNLADAGNVRRTVYAKISRHDLDSLLRLFDFPDANITSDKRTETTVPQQQLFILNSPFILQQAKALVGRLHGDPALADDSARVNQAFLLAYGRPAAADEIRLLVDFLHAPDSEGDVRLNKVSRWERAAHAILGSNEFSHLD